MSTPKMQRAGMPWYGWIGWILAGLAIITAAAEGGVTLRGAVIVVVGIGLGTAGLVRAGRLSRATRGADRVRTPAAPRL